MQSWATISDQKVRAENLLRKTTDAPVELIIVKRLQWQSLPLEEATANQ